MRDLIREHLARLVAFDTTNPPRAIDGAHGAIAYVADRLDRAGFAVAIDDLGDGSVNVLARRGAPRRLFNVHLDTVPAVPGWSRDPHELALAADRAVGLGACDIKGAAAGLLAAAETTTGAAALLLTTDEEAGRGRCVRTFLERSAGTFAEVVVAEPTGCRAVTAHRGLVSADVVFHGRAAHASGAAAGAGNALHHAAQWSAAAVAWSADGADDGGMRLNIGRIEGGTKPNVAAARAHVAFGLRPPPGWSGDALETVRDLAPADAHAEWSPRFLGPSLAADDRALRLASELGVETAAPVDFWTEAALFADAGLPAIVFGPGDIRQAHTADEWVALDDLDRAAAVYHQAFKGD